MSVVEANLIITKTLFTIVYDSMENESFHLFIAFLELLMSIPKRICLFLWGWKRDMEKLFTTHLQAINLYVILEQKNCFIRK